MNYFVIKNFRFNDNQYAFGEERGGVITGNAGKIKGQVKTFGEIGINVAIPGVDISLTNLYYAGPVSDLSWDLFGASGSSYSAGIGAAFISYEYSNFKTHTGLKMHSFKTSFGISPVKWKWGEVSAGVSWDYLDIHKQGID